MTDLTVEAKSMAAVYRLLSRLWLREVDRETLDALRSGELASAYGAADGWLPEDTTPSTIEQLAVEYCEVFVDPRGSALPYQSVWVEGRHEGDASSSMLQYLEIVGRDRDLDVPLDHLGVAMDVMATILEASSSNADCLPLASEFWGRHLDWGTPVCEAIERCRSDFYAGLARVTRSFLHVERRRWQSDDE